MLSADLIQRCKNGEHRAQRQLFDQYCTPMYNVCLRYLRSDFDAEEALSKGFTKVFAGMGRFNYEGEAALKAWIKKIMINECLMLLRSKNNFSLVPITEASDIMHHDARLENMDTRYILECIAALPAGYRTVLNLYIVEAYKHHEIAAMLGIAESTSRSQLNKAKQALKEKLLQYNIKYGKG
ncbi:MAG: sigma-70 family RNA polymerase sigma factor [Niastella sp.]|nr:sigma-70 family RNA polymerase sigma factor [Niastella sp.]